MDVVGFGALNLDQTFRVHQIAHEDEESYITSVSSSPGGSAANTIVGLSRLGVNTGFIGKVAFDPEGRRLLQSFRSEQVNIDSVLIAEAGTSGVVYCFVDVKGERAMYINPGVNDTLIFEELSTEYCQDVDFLHCSSFTGPHPFHAQIQFWRYLHDTRLSVDPGTIYAMKGLQRLKPLIQDCHVFFPNERELRLMTGKDYIKGAQILLDLGIQIVAVKLGHQGCYVTDGREAYTIPALNVQVKDTTGAGDAFNTGFLYGLHLDKDLYACGSLGNFVAAHTLQKQGARYGLPYQRDLVNKRV